MHLQVVALAGKTTDIVQYKVSIEIDSLNHLTSAPCGVCPGSYHAIMDSDEVQHTPTLNTSNLDSALSLVSISVRSHCTEGGVISPSTCEYMKNWLSMPSASSMSEEMF